MTPQLQDEILTAAGLAISAHNVQPFRFRFEETKIFVYVESGRLLPAADPTEKDLRMSFGALLETLSIYFSNENRSFRLEQPPGARAETGKPYAVLVVEISAVTRDALKDQLKRRYSYRGFFDKVSPQELRTGSESLRKQDFRVITENAEKKLVAQLYQSINHTSLIKPGYIEELFSWLRFKPSHPKWAHDGLNVESLSLSKLEAFGASFVMDPQVFRFLDRLKLAAPLIDESARILSAPWIVAIVCPSSLNEIDKGRIFLRKWLELTALDIYGAPLSLLTDSPEIMDRLKPVFGLQDTETFVNIMRCGLLPANHRRPLSARLSNKDLLWNP